MGPMKQFLIKRRWRFSAVRRVTSLLSRIHQRNRPTPDAAQGDNPLARPRSGCGRSRKAGFVELAKGATFHRGRNVTR